MSIFRKPLGAYTRNTPDWFAGKAAAGYGFCFSGTGVIPSVQLYNNATDGSKLFVYGFGADVYDDFEASWGVFQGSGTKLYNPNAILNNTYPIETGDPQPFGQIWIGTTSNLTQSGMYLTGGQGVFNNNWAVAPVFANHPLCIIRPGYSFAAISFGIASLGAFFHYVVMPT